MLQPNNKPFNVLDVIVITDGVLISVTQLFVIKESLTNQIQPAPVNLDIAEHFAIFALTPIQR